MRAGLLATIAGIAALLGGCGPGRESQDTRLAAPGEDGSETQAAASQAPAEFAQCRACHSVVPGQLGVAPSLFGIVGKTAASQPGFTYSPALKASGIVWDRASLDRWLEAPPRMVPGTRMIMGMPNAERRKVVIDYLETLK